MRRALLVRQRVRHPLDGAEPACGAVLECHPFYTGKQKLVDTGGRVERFQRRYAKSNAAKPTGKSSAGPSKSEQANGDN